MGKGLLIQLICCFGTSLALKSWQIPDVGLRALVASSMDDKWIKFKTMYNKTYLDEQDELTRRLYWEDTIRFIRMHNIKFDLGEVTYSLGENEFADLAEDEFENIYMKKTTTKDHEDDEKLLYLPDNLTKKRVDWRGHGLVTPVKSEGRFPSSWIIAPLESLEGVYKKTKGGKLQSLSVQNVMDCCKNVSFREGQAADVYRYIINNGGIDGDTCYRAEAPKGKFDITHSASNLNCHYTERCKAATCTGYRTVNKDERSLADAVASVGPVAIAMDVNDRKFWFYRKGIYYSSSCSRTRLNHDMLVVGYGSIRNRREYWIIKNSWGKSWGDRGYVYTARNRNNMCGIASSATYPTV